MGQVELPNKAPGFWLDRLPGGVYACRCTKQMADDVARHFNSTMAESA